MTFQERYTLVKKVGSSPGGDMFLATDKKMGRHVLIKTLRIDAGDNKQESEQRQKRFLREAKLSGKLIHPHILTLYDVGKIDEDLFIAIEYVEGQPLDFFLRDQTALPVTRVIKIILQIVDALEYAAGQSVFHRNLSPHSVTILADDQVKIQDFGMAPPVPADNPVSGSTGTVNPGYVAPEIILGRPSDSRADIFSLGCIMYQMLTGTRPFSGRSASSVYHKILNSPPEEWMQRLSYLPPQVTAIVAKMLEKEPENRYATYGELIEDLNGCRHIVQVMEEKTTISATPLLTNGRSRTGDRKSSTTSRKKVKTPLPVNDNSTKTPVVAGSSATDHTSVRSIQPAVNPDRAVVPQPALRDIRTKGPGRGRKSPIQPTARRSEFAVFLGFLLVFSFFIITVVWLFWGDISFVLKYFGSATPMNADQQYPGTRDQQRSSVHPNSGISADATERGTLSLSSEPGGARAFVNGQYCGETPLKSLRLAPGNHEIRIERDGYAVWQQQLTIDVGTTRTINAPLVQVANVSITTVPPGASISVDGIPRGFSPTELHDLGEGTYELLLSKDGFQPHREALVITRDDRQRSLSIPLRRTAVGSIRIATESGVTVSLNGEKRTTGSGMLSNIPIGNHTISLSIKGKTPKKLTVTVVENRTVEVTHYFFKPGLLRVNAIPFGTAFLNGKELGVTPVVVEVPVGEHDLKIEKDGYITARTKVTIKEGREEQIFLTLEKVE